MTIRGIPQRETPLSPFLEAQEYLAKALVVVSD